MSAELIAFVQSFDRCWIEGRFEALADFLATGVVMVAPGGGGRLEGIDEAIGSYRSFMARASVERFETGDFKVTDRGNAAVVEYRWDMAWTDAGISHLASGREVLVLARFDNEWRIIWRTQLSE
jgi:ketosteroid isomerase-like protein